MQLQRVAVAEHDSILLLQLKGLLPPPRIDLHPVCGLPVFVSTVGFSARGRIFGHDWPWLLPTPGRLTGRTRPFNSDDHWTIIQVPDAALKNNKQPVPVPGWSKDLAHPRAAVATPTSVKPCHLTQNVTGLKSMTQ